MADTVDLGFLGRKVEQILSELREMRLDNRLIKSGFLKVSDMLSRMNQRTDFLDRRISEVRDDGDTMLRMELGGSLTHVETRLDERFAIVGDRFAELNDRFAQVDARFAQVDDRFAQVHDRFDRVEDRFAAVNERFDQVNDQLVAVNERLDARFANVNDRFEELKQLILGLSATKGG